MNDPIALARLLKRALATSSGHERTEALRILGEPDEAHPALDTDPHSYSLVAVFNRCRGEDGDIIEERLASSGLTGEAEAAVAQLTAELEDAYHNGNVAGSFEVLWTDY